MRKCRLGDLAPFSGIQDTDHLLARLDHAALDPDFFQMDIRETVLDRQTACAEKANPNLKITGEIMVQLTNQGDGVTPQLSPNDKDLDVAHPKHGHRHFQAVGDNR